MKYALLGDLHSSIDDTKAVLAHINEIAKDSKIIGLGDLYECLIDKKKAQKIDGGIPLHEAAVINEEFEALLTFHSIRGNQEERIFKVTGLKRYLHYPEILEIENATLIHGHQIEWTKHWKPIKTPIFSTPLLFFGHSHNSALYQNYKKRGIQFNQPISVTEQCYAINVGSVVVHREWCLYDSDEQTVTFMKAT